VTAPAPAAAASALPVRYAGLDLLRLLAASCVFLQHFQDHFGAAIEPRLQALGPTLGAYLLALLHHAHVGVDLFFVLSGCSLGLYAQRYFVRNQALPIRAYAISRFRRLYPAFFFALLVAVASRKDSWHLATLRPLALNATLLGGYLPPGSMILNASWSLTTEVLFYLAFPWLAQRLLRTQMPRQLPNALKGAPLQLGAGLLVVSFGLRALCHYLALAAVPGQSYLLELTQRRLAPCRMDQFVWGIGCAYVLRQASKWTRAQHGLACAGGVLALLALLPLEGSLYYTRYGALPYALYWPALAAIVLGAANLRPSFASLLGERSYGFFLYHEVAIGLTIAAAHRLGADSAPGHPYASPALLVAILIVAYAAALAAGALSFATIERWSRER
jgi:peptidoglycan/LPS O-acetylase OafA/YrhL